MEKVSEIRRVYKARRIKGFEYPSDLRKAENPIYIVYNININIYVA